MSAQPWRRSGRADQRALPLADRHYNRQKVGTRQFVPPGRCLVLLTDDADALWVTSWPFAEHVRHAWPGAMVCSIFRREPDCEHRASDLVASACAATRARWPVLPEQGMVTFIDPAKVRRKRDPGRCFRRSGFVEVGRTADLDLIVLQLRPGDFPPALPTRPRAAARGQGDLLDLLTCDGPDGSSPHGCRTGTAVA
jgi:hypothetical protein